ncbi:MAG TPA: alpha/beta fold hydrolase [Pirellulaceae bacterium]|nr:alpha/beta fold hydrolase [Pirellulaceae bacterium]
MRSPDIRMLVGNVRSWIFRLGGCLAALAWLASQTGCVTLDLDLARKSANVISLGMSDRLGTRAVQRTDVMGPIKKQFSKPPSPSDRTQQLLRRYVLDAEYKLQPEKAIEKLQRLAEQAPTLERVHAVAELAFMQGEWATRMGRADAATRFYVTALDNAHRFLFDQDLDLQRNAYDPQFRSICDIYNQSLEAIIRRMIKDKTFQVGAHHTLAGVDRHVEFTIAIQGRWRDEAIERFEIVHDFEPRGVHNHFRTHGLGVPLIAVRKQDADDDPLDLYYPPGLTMAFTAFLEIPSQRGEYTVSDLARGEAARLKLFDPLEHTIVREGHMPFPLESDITTPVAYFLDNPLLSTNVLATFALLNAEFAQQFHGVYLLEPYDPNKIPVVLIHGLWSSPVTWLQMFNDLRADPEIQTHYQFWFCLYPTGQPFWESARQVRNNLRKLKAELRTRGPTDQLDQTILVGHSMGGLIARMLTSSSGNEFWGALSDQPFAAMQGDEESLRQLAETLFFEPEPGIARMICIGTPHQGSSFANLTTQWIAQRLITLPKMMNHAHRQLVTSNRTVIRDPRPLTMSTSIDSLSPNCALIQALQHTTPSPYVARHNIIGRLENQWWISKLMGAESGDGIVSLKSAAWPASDTSLEVAADHQTIHQNPRTILEIKRVLYEHLSTAGHRLDDRHLILPARYQLLEPMPVK